MAQTGSMVHPAHKFVFQIVKMFFENPKTKFYGTPSKLRYDAAPKPHFLTTMIRRIGFSIQHWCVIEKIHGNQSAQDTTCAYLHAEKVKNLESSGVLLKKLLSMKKVTAWRTEIEISLFEYI